MYAEALDYLTCPRHPLILLKLEEAVERAADGELVAGWTSCPLCHSRYPLRNGILDLLGPLELPNSPAQLTNYLPPAAWAYERSWRPRALSLLSGERFGYRRELPLIVGMAAPERGGLIVDVACSNGLYARALERARDAPGHVVGIDHALPMLRQAREYARTAGLRISYVRAKAQRLPFGSGVVASLAMGGSLNEIGDMDAALRELRRVLAPDGCCALMSLARAVTSPGQLLQNLLSFGGLNFPSTAALNRRLAATKLRLRAQWQHGVVVFSLLTA